MKSQNYQLVCKYFKHCTEQTCTKTVSAIENWQKLETLNLSHNQIKALPPTLCKINTLRRLFVNDNLLDFEGIPSGIGKLGNLEIFAAANNQLEMIPEGLCRYYKDFTIMFILQSV